MKLVFLLFLLAAAASVSSSNDFNVSVASTDPVVAPEPLAAGNVHSPDVDGPDVDGPDFNEEVEVLAGESIALLNEVVALLPEWEDLPAAFDFYGERNAIIDEGKEQLGVLKMAVNLILESCVS